MKIKIEKWVRDINSVKIELLRSTPLPQDSKIVIDLHLFADVSMLANCGAAYAVVYKPYSVNQGLVTSTLGILKQNITFLRYELISTQMGANLVYNVKPALEDKT